MHAIDIVIIVVTVVLFVGAMQFYGPRLATYRVTSNAIELVWFGRRAWRCPLEDVIEVRRISYLRGLFTPTLHLMNRPFGRFVLLRRRSGVFRAVLLSPDDPDEFIGRVRRVNAASPPS